MIDELTPDELDAILQILHEPEDWFGNPALEPKIVSAIPKLAKMRSERGEPAPKMPCSDCGGEAVGSAFKSILDFGRTLCDTCSARAKVRP